MCFVREDSDYTSRDKTLYHYSKRTDLILWYHIYLLLFLVSQSIATVASLLKYRWTPLALRVQTSLEPLHHWKAERLWFRSLRWQATTAWGGICSKLPMASKSISCAWMISRAFWNFFVRLHVDLAWYFRYSLLAGRGRGSGGPLLLTSWKRWALCRWCRVLEESW